MEKPAEKIPGPIKQPVWMKTAFGWVVLGVEGGFAVCLDWIEKGKGDEEYLDWIEKGKEEREREEGVGEVEAMRSSPFSPQGSSSTSYIYHQPKRRFLFSFV